MLVEMVNADINIYLFIFGVYFDECNRYLGLKWTITLSKSQRTLQNSEKRNKWRKKKKNRVNKEVKKTERSTTVDGLIKGTWWPLKGFFFCFFLLGGRLWPH